ncbi:hypothetical protein ABK040_011701 [Willaertia magna]
MSMEHLLVLTTVERIGDSLPSTPSSQRRRGYNLKGYIKTLNDVVVLPNIDLHKVIQPLVDLYDNIAKTSIQSSLKQNDKKVKLELLNKSKLIVLNLLSEYLDLAIDQRNLILPNHHLNNMFYDFDEEDLLNEEEKEEEEAEENEELIELKENPQQNQEESELSTPTLDKNEAVQRATNKHKASIVFKRKILEGTKKAKELDETTALNLFQLVATRLLLNHDIFYDSSTEEGVVKNSNIMYLESQINYKCTEILFKLSISNSEALFKAAVTDAIATCNNNNCMDIPFNSDLNEDKKPFTSCLAHLKLVEFMNWNGTTLEKLLRIVNENMKGYNKYEEVLSQPLRLAVWNFIINFSDAYLVTLKSSSSSLVATSLNLFENLYKNMKKKSKRMVWPLLATLMLLLSDEFSKCIKAGNKNSVGSFYKELLKQLDEKDKSHALNPIMDLYSITSYMKDLQDSPAHQFANTVHDKLVEIFFPSQPYTEKNKKPYSDAEVNELELMSEFIIAFYLRNPTKCKQQVFSVAFEDGTVEQRQAVSKALLYLVSNRKITGFQKEYAQLIPSIRDLFREVFEEFNENSNETSNYSANSGSSKVETPTKLSTKKSFKSLAERFGEKFGGGNKDTSSVASGQTQSSFKLFDTVNTLLHTFCSDPLLFLTKGTDVQGDKKHYNDRNFTMLAECFVDNDDPLIQDQIIRLFQKLFLQNHIKDWSPEDVFIGFTNISTDVLSRLSQALFELNEIEQLQQTKQLLFLLRTITYRSKKFYIDNREQILLIDQIVNGRKRLQSLEILASNLLVCLCSTDKEIWINVTRCLRDVCDQIEALGNQNLKYLNYNFYRQLSGVDINGKVYNERKSQIQLFRRVEYQTKTNLAAFNEVYNRWRSLITNQATDDINSTITWKELFSNYTSLLCALGGVCIQRREETKEKQSTPVPKVSPMASQMLGSKQTKDDASAENVDNFINDLMKQIICDNPNIRQMVTYSISTDLAPALYEKLFFHMKKSTQEQLGQNFAVTPKNDMLVDQYLFIVKTIVESPDATFDLTLATELDSNIELFVNYCTHGAFDSRSMIDMKMKVCSLIEALFSKAEYISFNDEQKFRRNIVKQVMDWTSDFALKEGHEKKQNTDKDSLLDHTNVTSELRKSYAELDQSCLKAIASLLTGLEIANDDKGRQEYSTYFSLLLRILKKAKDSNVTLHQLIFKAFSRLLQTNISFGLEYYMSKVYDKDETVRSTFMALLSELIKRGLLVEEEEKEQNQGATISKYQPLINKLVFTNRKRALFALFAQCKNPEKDELCEAVIRVFQSKGNVEVYLLDLLRNSVLNEVGATPLTQPETLFRSNSTASKLMTKYCLRSTPPYLEPLIGDFVHSMCSNPKKFEVDPSKAQQRGEDVNENVKNLTEVFQNFIDRLCDSINQTPYTLRCYCRFLYEEVGKKFHKLDNDDQQFDFKYIAVGGFLILRLLCPALLNPVTYGLTSTELSTDARRYGILLTKLIQNLANGVLPNVKEEFMKAFVDVTRDNMQKIQDFFEACAQPVREDEDIPKLEENVTEDELKEAYTVLYKFFYNYAESLRDDLSKLYDDVEDDQKIAIQEQSTEEARKSDSRKSLKNKQQGGKTLYDILEDSIESLGKPPEETKSGKRTSGKKKKDEDEFSNYLFDEFMRKNENRDSSKVEETKFFYVSEKKNAKGQHVVYFVPNNLDLTRFPFELYQLYVLRTMENIWKEPYCLVVDCTLWSKKRDIKLVLLLTLSRHIPQGAKANLQDIYVVNPNNFANKTTKKLVSHLHKVRWHVATSYSFQGIQEDDAEIEAPIEKNTKGAKSKAKTKYALDLENPAHNALPALTQNLVAKSEVVFDNVQSVYSSHVKECELRMYDQYLFILVKDEKFINNKYESKSVEHIPISRITGISTKKSLFGGGKGAKGTKEFIVKYIDDDDTEASYSLKAQSNEDREQISQAIRSYIERKTRGFKSSQQVDKDFKRLKPQDVPGQLLAISFFNIDSKSHQTRTSAYTLLTSIINQLKIKNAESLALESDIAQVPRNTEDVVLKISTFVAKHKPDLTLEFLSETLSAFKTMTGMKSKLKCASFIVPWLENLAPFVEGQEEGDEKVEKVKQWLETFAKLCCEYEEIYPSLKIVWETLCKIPALTHIVVESVLRFGISSDMGLHGDQSLVGDILESIIMHTPKELNVSECIINKIVDSIMNGELNIDQLNKLSTKELAKSKEFAGKVPIYVQYLLMLSFHNHLDLMQNLPSLLYLITVLVGIGGDALLRSTLYGLFSNILHSLILIVPEEFSESRQALIKLQEKMLSTDVKSLFMGGPTDPIPFASSLDHMKLPTTKFEELNMYKYEGLVRFMKEMIDCFEVVPYEGTDFVLETESVIETDQNEQVSIKQYWLREYTDLCKETMKAANIIFFPRSLVAYSIVASAEQSYDMIPFVLNFLGKRGVDTLNDDELMLSIILSICQFCDSIVLLTKEKIGTIRKLTLFGLFFLTVANSRTFSAVVKLLSKTFNMLFEAQDINNDYLSIGDYFNNCYKLENKHSEFVKSYESATGLIFGEHFSFTLSLLLMKGLTASDTSTRRTTVAFIKQLVQIGSKLKYLQQSQLGFYTALIPFDKQYNSVLFSDQLFTREMFEHDKGERVFLFQKFLFLLVTEIKDYTCEAAVYKTLARGFEAISDVFEPVFQDHFSMTQVIRTYSSSQDDYIIEQSLNLFKIMSNHSKSRKLNIKEPFADCGFEGFKGHLTFNTVKAEVKKKSTQLVANYLVENFNEKEYTTLDSVIVSKKKQPKLQAKTSIKN